MVALDSDFSGLGRHDRSGGEGVRRGRKIGNEEAPVMNRLYTIEPQFSVTGAAADHRFRIKSSEVGGICFRAY